MTADAIMLGILFGSEHDDAVSGPRDLFIAAAKEAKEKAEEKAEAKEAKSKAEAEQAEAKAAIEAAKAKADAKDAGKEADSDIDSVIDEISKIVTIAGNSDDREISGNKAIIISALSTAEGS